LRNTEINLREGSHRLPHDRQDPPDHNCHAYQTGHASKGRQSGHHRTGQPSPSWLRELDTRDILELTTNKQNEFILKINFVP
jgi:hypothetical protein